MAALAARVTALEGRVSALEAADVEKVPGEATDGSTGTTL